MFTILLGSRNAFGSDPQKQENFRNSQHKVGELEDLQTPAECCMAEKARGASARPSRVRSQRLEYRQLAEPT